MSDVSADVHVLQLSVHGQFMRQCRLTVAWLQFVDHFHGVVLLMVGGMVRVDQFGFEHVGGGATTQSMQYVQVLST